MRVVFIGTGEIGVPTLQALLDSTHEVVGIVTQPDKPAGREQKVRPPPIKAALTRNEGFLEVLQPPRIKDPAAVESIRALQPDVIVVVAYGQILPAAVLEIPRIACLNVHASLLPRWRGAAPIQFAIAAGDNETGVTIMFMDEGLDTGDILLQQKIAIAADETGGSLHDRIAQIAPRALLESLELLPDAPRQPQDSAQVTLSPKLNREHGRIDWLQPAEVIERKIRAYNPWPGAFTELAGRHLKVFAATLVSGTGPSGKILPFEDELVMAAGDGALALREVQLEGKRRMTGREFRRGHSILLSKDS
jgi:methionyl-tRNA formyltransferase